MPYYVSNMDRLMDALRRPAVWLIPVVVAAVARGRGGERTLRDAYANGEVNESEYRERLAVLRDTRR